MTFWISTTSYSKTGGATGEWFGFKSPFGTTFLNLSNIKDLCFESS